MRKDVKLKENNCIIVHLPKCKISIKESSDNPPQGIIIDILDKEEEFVDSYTFWYNDLEE